MKTLDLNQPISRNSTKNRKNSLDNSLENKGNSSECIENAFFSGCYSSYHIFDTDWRHFVNVPTLFGSALQSSREGSDFAL